MRFVIVIRVLFGYSEQWSPSVSHVRGCFMHPSHDIMIVIVRGLI